MDKAGRGALEPPPEDAALERSNLTEKFQFRESHTEVEPKKSLDQIPVLSKNKSLYVYVSVVYMCCRKIPYCAVPGRTV